MRKIPTLFVRDPDNMKLVTDQVVPGLEWVLKGQCVAREKLDGTACAVLCGRLYKRFTAQLEAPMIEGVTPPDGFMPADSAHIYSGKQPGWIPVGGGPEDQWHREAMELEDSLSNGTYELVGPKVQGDPYGFRTHALLRHDVAASRRFGSGVITFDLLRENMGRVDTLFRPWEGIVFWGPEGPVAKIKRRDFGLPWPVKSEETKAKIEDIRRLGSRIKDNWSLCGLFDGTHGACDAEVMVAQTVHASIINHEKRGGAFSFRGEGVFKYECGGLADNPTAYLMLVDRGFFVQEKRDGKAVIVITQKLVDYVNTYFTRQAG